jgi:hypothetical protein
MEKVKQSGGGGWMDDWPKIEQIAISFPKSIQEWPFHNIRQTKSIFVGGGRRVGEGIRRTIQPNLGSLLQKGMNGGLGHNHSYFSQHQLHLMFQSILCFILLFIQLFQFDRSFISSFSTFYLKNLFKEPIFGKFKDEIKLFSLKKLIK